MSDLSRNVRYGLICQILVEMLRRRPSIFWTCPIERVAVVSNLGRDGRLSLLCRAFQKGGARRNICQIWAELSDLGRNVRCEPKCQIWAEMSDLGRDVRFGLRCQIWAEMSDLARDDRFRAEMSDLS